MPFPGALGRGLKIAVIDSGVNLEHPHIVAETRQVALGDAGYAGDDLLGHGTAVMAAIQEKAPEAKYYAVKLFGSSLRTTANRLLEAIEWAIGNEMDLVNLSLGTPNFEHLAEMERLVGRAREAGTLLVAARHAAYRPVLPGSLQGVLAVDVDWQLPRHSYRAAVDDRGIFFYASGYPRPLPGLPPGRNLNGISFAVANLTGIAARCCERLPNRFVEAVCEALAGTNPS
ncbi:MAG: hypothetical protein C5B51_07250 [Terriglobia bacterium]|nr:MAG: hypothetical protein C5B51_07250 [Terriglobia bacterium]